MGLLKTVFEVNLGLFGKKSTDGYVHNHNFLLSWFLNGIERVEQADELCYSSSFVTILDKHLLRTWKPH